MGVRTNQTSLEGECGGTDLVRALVTRQHTAMGPMPLGSSPTHLYLGSEREIMLVSHKTFRSSIWGHQELGFC